MPEPEPKKAPAEKKQAASRFRFYFAGVLTLVMLAAFDPWFIVGRHSDGLLYGPEGMWQDKLYAVHEASIEPGDPKVIIAAIDEDTIKDSGIGWPFQAEQGPA